MLIEDGINKRFLDPVYENVPIKIYFKVKYKMSYYIYHLIL